jgi:hypothetical protein
MPGKASRQVRPKIVLAAAAHNSNHVQHSSRVNGFRAKQLYPAQYIDMPSTQRGPIVNNSSAAVYAEAKLQGLKNEEQGLRQVRCRMYEPGAHF